MEFKQSWEVLTDLQFYSSSDPAENFGPLLKWSSTVSTVDDMDIYVTEDTLFSNVYLKLNKYFEAKKGVLKSRYIPK